MTERYPIRGATQEVNQAIFWWCDRRGIVLDQDDYDTFTPHFAFYSAEDEVRWGRALKEMMADVESEMSARDLDRDTEYRSHRTLGRSVEVVTRTRFKHSSWFVDKYPELKDLLEGS